MLSRFFFFFTVASELALGSKAEIEEVLLNDLWYNDSPQELEAGPPHWLHRYEEVTELSLLPQTSSQPFPGLCKKTA